MASDTLFQIAADAIPVDSVPEWPRVELLRAEGGERTYDIVESREVAPGRVMYAVDAREAQPGELLRDDTLRFRLDASKVLDWRTRIALNAESDPRVRSAVLAYCKADIRFWINTFCWTLDPRETGQHSRTLPFATFEFQDDLIGHWVWAVARSMSVLTEKSRDMGASWCAAAICVWLCLFHDGMQARLMSKNESDVDNRMPGSLMGKVRFILNHLPSWMRGGWVERAHVSDTHMHVGFPDTGSAIQGILSGGTAGRSDRATVTFADEFAFVEESHRVLDALSDLSNAKVYLSTPNGQGNAFAEMADNPATSKRSLHWSIHPQKNDEWAKKRRNEPDMSEERWSREHEIAYETSVIGRVFPQFVRTSLGSEVWCHVQDGDLVAYEGSVPVWTSSDLGSSDPCCTLWAQIKPAPPEYHIYGTRYTLVFFAEHERRDMTAWDLRYLLNTRGFRYHTHVMDLRTADNRDSAGKTWRSNLAEAAVNPVYSKVFGQTIDPGPPIFIDGNWSYEEPTLIRFRDLLQRPGALAFSRDGVPHLIRAIQNWSYPLDPRTREPRSDASPKHDKWSHAAKAAIYLVDFCYDRLIRPESHMPASTWDMPAFRPRVR